MRDGVKVLSPQTSQVSTRVSTNVWILGVAYDTIRNKIYWSTIPNIYRRDANDDSSPVETVLSTSACEFN